MNIKKTKNKTKTITMDSLTNQSKFSFLKFGKKHHRVNATKKEEHIEEFEVIKNQAHPHPTMKSKTSVDPVVYANYFSMK
ncbi:unnamed protein product [Cunninghamella blakesleeana]